MSSERPRGLPGDFLVLLSASSVSFLGDGLSIVAYPWLASLLTKDGLLVAGVIVASRLPWLLVSLPAGVLVDRFDRRRMMVLLNALRFVLTSVVATMVFTDAMTLWLLYASALLIGTADVTYSAAAEALTGRIVPRDHLAKANGRLLGAQILLTQLAGPPIGGLLIGVGLSFAFIGDAVSFGLAAALLLFMSGTYKVERQVVRSFGAELAEGVRFLWSVPILRTLALTLGILNLIVTMVISTFVLYTREVLHLNSTGYGLLLAIGAVGGVVGSLGAAWVKQRLGTAVALNAVSVVGTACYLMMASTSNIAIVAGASFTFSAAVIVWNTVAASLRQSLTPGDLLGRVSSASRWLGWGTMSVGGLLGGFILHMTEPVVGREWAVRSPLLFAAIALTVTFAFTVRTITEAQIRK